MEQIWVQQSINVGTILVGALVGILIGILFGALILRAACSVYNKSCPVDDRVKEPALGKAVGIVFVRNFFVVSFVAPVLIVAREVRVPLSPLQRGVVGAILLLVSFLTGVWILSDSLRTTGRRAANIVGLELLFSMVMSAILFGAGFLISINL